MVKQEDSSEEVACTPNRTTTDAEQQKMNSAVMTTETKTVPNTVTPPEANVKEEAGGDSNDKQVRFGKDQVQPAASGDAATYDQPRRNRYTSGNSQSGGAVLQFKTYRSPSRKRDEEVPSLCSTSSEAPAEKSSKSGLPASSISVDPSQATTSPLASSHEGEKHNKDAQENGKDDDHQEVSVSENSNIYLTAYLCGSVSDSNLLHLACSRPHLRNDRNKSGPCSKAH